MLMRCSGLIRPSAGEAIPAPIDGYWLSKNLRRAALLQMGLCKVLASWCEELADNPVLRHSEHSGEQTKYIAGWWTHSRPLRRFEKRAVRPGNWPTL